MTYTRDHYKNSQAITCLPSSRAKQADQTNNIKSAHEKGIETRVETVTVRAHINAV